MPGTVRWRPACTWHAPAAACSRQVECMQSWQLPMLYAKGKGTGGQLAGLPLGAAWQQGAGRQQVERQLLQS